MLFVEDQLTLSVSSPSTAGEFVEAYARALGTAAVDVFAVDASPRNAELLTLAMYNAVHDSAPENARMVLMFSGGKDSSAAAHYYVESVEARVAAGLRFVPATILAASVGHEFTDVEIRQRKEIAALNKWGGRYGINAEIVYPQTKDTVLVELIGNGFALPPKATNDKVVSASISNWCVDRVKRKLLDSATKRAVGLAPVVIQVFGSRYDESTSRDFRMRKYSSGLPAGLTRVALSEGNSAESQVYGLYAIGHFTDHMIRDFVHNAITSYRGIEGNLELEKIYRDASGNDTDEATECSIQRTADGGFAGGCSSLATGTRLGCMICLKATNLALKNLAAKDPQRYSLTYRVQEEINEHQRLVHARPKAILASGFDPKNMFPKGFTFITRYRWLVMILAAEIVSGERQLSDEQLAWIERRWKRHGVFTVNTRDARRDAELWVKLGATGEPPVFFRQFGDHSCEFTESLGEGMPLGAYGAYVDDEQGNLNLAHLMGFGITGGPVFPQVMAYLFDDVATPGDRFIMVTDTPSVIGTNTNTGLLNGAVGATLRCRGVRNATSWETRMADGRHLFYRYSKADVVGAKMDVFERLLAEGVRANGWTLSDFLLSNTAAYAEARKARDNAILCGFLSTALESFNVAGCGIDNDAITDAYFRGESISHLAGEISSDDLKESFNLISDLVSMSEMLQDATSVAHQELIDDLTAEIHGNWLLLSQESEEGSAMRSSIRSRLRDAIFKNGVSLQLFEEYVAALKDLAYLYVAGRMNTALATRIAFIVRTAVVYQPDAIEYLEELQRQLKLVRAVEPVRPAVETAVMAA